MRKPCSVCHQPTLEGTIHGVLVCNGIAMTFDRTVCNKCAERIVDVVDELVDAMRIGVLEPEEDPIDALIHDVFTRGWEVGA